MSVVYVIRCHEFTDEVRELYAALCTVASPDVVVLAIDQSRKQALIPSSIRHIKIDDEKIQKLGLPMFDKWGWQCGDYFYYAVASEVCSDYYWLIEPDVFLEGA